MTCARCDALAALPFAQRWVSDSRIAHCPDCHQTWTPSCACHCGRCHVVFRSSTVARQHERGDGCESPGALGLRPRVNIFGDKVWSPA